MDYLNDSSKPVVYAFKIRVPGYAQKTGKRLFLQPSFFEYGEPSMFSSASRKYDVYFHYPWTESDDIEIQLPPGYALDNADKPGPVLAGQISQYKLDLGVTDGGRELVCHRQFFFGGEGMILFPQTSYTQIKALFDQIHKNDEHTIALKQISATGN